MKFKDWYDRSSKSEKGGLDQDGFIKTADRFVNLANTLNKRVLATEIQYTMLFASARYSAHVGKNVLEIDNQENYIDHLVNQYRDMLRENFADPAV
tara:strand:- start:1865 stop:2152 length:288 start_codon:yes stop_codon:yes gene_type:complete